MITFNPAINNRNFNNKQKQISFQKSLHYLRVSDTVVDEDGKVYKPAKNTLLNTMGASFVSVVATALIAAVLHSDKKHQQEEFLRNVQEYVEDNSEVRKDTFTVADYNNDSIPDVILYKKDGSKVLLDVKNLKIQESVEGFRDIEK